MRYFYHPWSPNCRKTTAVIDHLGIEVEHRVIDLSRGEQAAPEFRAINPNGMVPTLVDGELVVTESNAIAIYLAETAGSDLWPGERALQLDVLRWMFWEQSHFMFACGTVFFNRLVKPMIGQEPDQARIDEGLAKFRRLAAVLDGALAAAPYLVGGRLSLADWAVAGNLCFADKIGLPVADFEHLAAWTRRLDETPAWQDSAPQG